MKWKIFLAIVLSTFDQFKPTYSLVFNSSATERFRSDAVKSSHNEFGKLSAESVNLKNSTGLSDGRLSPIVVHGNKFFTEGTGKQFFIKGIAYQPSRAAGDGSFVHLNGAKFIDPMAEPDICKRDLPYLVDLGVNTVRIYSIDSDRDHDECFEAFAKAGIYVIADLSEPDVSVVRESPVWDTTILQRYIDVVSSLQKYDNLLGFFAGNEVTNDRTNTDASPFVKSSIRDVKEYIKRQGYRQIPIGYSSNDDAETRASIADFFACGDVSADFYGINMYEWCGYSTYWASGYKERTEEFKNYPIPVFFSEFGCNTKRPRPFTEVEALYSRLMSDVWSGGIAYMFFEEPNQYGVVSLSDGKIVPLDDFKNLKDEFSKVDPKGISLNEFKSKVSIAKAPICPVNTKFWKASSIIPPSPDTKKCDCMESSLQCKLVNQIKPDELRSLFDYACGITDCHAIKGDGNSGDYGTFSDCSARQKASYVINEVFVSRGSKSQDCDFNGLAALNSRLATIEDLESIPTKDGHTCAEVLRTHTIKESQRLNSKLSNSTSFNETNPSISGRDKASRYSNRGSQIKFYHNLMGVLLFSLVSAITTVSLFG